MSNVRRALVVTVVAGWVAVIGARAAGVPATPRVAPGEASAQADGDQQRLLGTYKLVTSETKDSNGTWGPTPSFDSIGYITYGASGYMGVHVMPRGRAPFAGNRPTAEEAQEALRGYTAYYGPYTLNQADADAFVVHHRVGQTNPGGEVDAKRFYEFVGNQLILTPAPTSGGKDAAARRIVWERLPNVSLSAEAQKFVGFRQLLYTDRYTEQGGRVVTHGEENRSRAGSYIIYTSTGHMMVHLMAADGRTPYAGTTPTPEEALAAYRTYGGYFGEFTVHENDEPPYVVHHQEGRPNPGDPTDAVRLYLLDGDILRLGARPRTAGSESTGGHLYWELLPRR